MVFHGLRGTVKTPLFEEDHAEPSVALGSDYREYCSFSVCHNLRAKLGTQQQDGILGWYNHSIKVPCRFSSKDKNIASGNGNSKDLQSISGSLVQACAVSLSTIGDLSGNTTVIIKYANS